MCVLPILLTLHHGVSFDCTLLLLSIPSASETLPGYRPVSFLFNNEGNRSFQSTKGLFHSIAPFWLSFQQRYKNKHLFINEKLCLCKVLQRKSGTDAYNPRILEKEAGGLGLQGHPRLESKLEHGGF